MLAFIVVLIEPRIKIGLQGINRFVDILAEGDTIELVEHGLVQSLDDPVGLRRLGLRASVIDVFHGQIQLVFVMLGVAAVFSAAIRQHAQQRNAEAVEEWDDTIVQQVGRRHRSRQIISTTPMISSLP